MNEFLKKISFFYFLCFLFIPLHSFAHELPAQNVIFITFDGVRYNDIYEKPEKEYDFLEKKVYPLKYFQEWASANHGYFFGTQKKNDQMLIGNSSGFSLPGYLAIFSGQYESKCENNNCIKSSQNETLVDHLRDEVEDPKKIALFSSWDKIRFSTQKINPSEIVQSFGMDLLENFLPLCRNDFNNLFRFFKIESYANQKLPEWPGREDSYTWELGIEYVKAYEPRFTYISLLATDEWAHKNDMENYFRSLNEYDQKLMELIKMLESEKYKKFLDNTSIVITTDHGRGEDDFTFGSHGKFLGKLIEGSQYVWSMVIPSKSLRENFLVARSLPSNKYLPNKNKEKKFSQLQIRPTIETLLNEKNISSKDSLIAINSSTNTLNTAAFRK